MRSRTGYYPPRNPTFTAGEGFIITQRHSRVLGFGVANSLLENYHATPQPNLRLLNLDLPCRCLSDRLDEKDRGDKEISLSPLSL
jgi:hypothetical protein